MTVNAQRYAIPVVSFVGISGSGKTTFLVRLIAELTRRGWRVATAKHHHLPDFEFDKPGKDSWRHADAGAVVSMIASDKKLGMVRKIEREPSVEEFVGFVEGTADILIMESFRNPEAEQIEIVRTAHSDRLTCDPASLFALVTDGSFDVDSPVFALDDIEGVADLIEGTLLAQSRKSSAAGKSSVGNEPGGRDA
ncbi:MAG: molybdopterin-guanine dinucleotide biosynthesis protein B [Coriobacteriia bacterium]